MKIAINLTDYYRGSVGGIRVYLVSLARYLPKVATKDTIYVVCRPEATKEFSFPGIKIIEVDHEFQGKSLSTKLLDIIKEYKLDLWYSPLLVLDPLNCPIPCIFSIPDMQHEKFPEYFDPNVLRWRRLQMARSAMATDHIITISEFSKKDIVKHLQIDESKVSVTYLSTPYWHDQKYSKKTNAEVIKKYNLSPKKYFFFPANTWPHKNLSRLLQAFATIKDKYPEIEVVLVVQSAQIDPKLKKIINKNDLEKRIKFTGFVDDKYMQYIFKNSLAVVSPSLFEGFGIPPLEAMKNGVPVACSNVTSHPEICGNAALYFDPLSIDAMAKSMEKLITSSRLRKTLISKGLVRVKEFNYQKTTRQTYQIFKNVYDNFYEKPKINVKKYPKITIVTPSFNQGKYIERTIKSVLDQKYPNLEYIVMDGGSTDNTVEILKKYDGKIFWKSEKDRGQTHAINKGLKIATGEIFGYLNSDDTLEPKSLETVAQYFISHPTEKLVFGRGKIIDSKDKYVEDYHNLPSNFDTLFDSCDLSQPSVFWRKEIVKELGYFNEQYDFAMDYEYWVRISLKHKLNYIQDYLSNTRTHEDTKTNTQTLKVHKNVIAIEKKYYGKVNDDWIQSYANVLLDGIDHRMWLPQLRFWISQFFIINYLQIRHNHKTISKNQLVNILHHLKDLAIHNPAKSKFLSFLPSHPTLNRVLHRIYYIIFRDGPLYKFVEIGILKQHPPKKLYKEIFPESTSKKHLKISIVTPSYNQGNFIKRTVDSVLNQHYPDLEYIVQDGASTDKTVSVLKKYGSKLKFESKKDNGQTDAINKGFINTSGEIMAYLNSDDMYCDGTLDYVNNFFTENPDVDVLYGHRLIVNEKDNQIGRWVLPPCNLSVLEFLDYIPQETMFWRRSIWNKIGGTLDDSFRFAMDWDLILKFIKADAVFYRAPYFLGIFRHHSLQKTATQINSVGQQECDRLMIRTHGRAITNQELIALLDKYRRKAAFFSLALSIKVRL